MAGLIKLKEAAHLIEDMTGCRFKSSMGGAFIYPDRDEYLAVNMRKEGDYSARVYRIHFDVHLQTMGCPMTSAALSKLEDEVGQAVALLHTLETQEYVLTPEEMQEFDGFVRDLERLHEEQEQEQSNGPVMKPPGY